MSLKPSRTTLTAAYIFDNSLRLNGNTIENSQLLHHCLVNDNCQWQHWPSLIQQSTVNNSVLDEQLMTYSLLAVLIDFTLIWQVSGKHYASFNLFHHNFAVWVLTAYDLWVSATEIGMLILKFVFKYNRSKWTVLLGEKDKTSCSKR